MIYLHIPKTGGQTLAHRLASAFAPGRTKIMLPDLTFPQDVDALQALLSENDLVEAHVSGPILADVTAADILCTVRDPVPRIVSSFLHMRRDPGDRLHRAAHALRPAEFFRNYAAYWDNQQSRNLVEALVPPGERAAIEGSSPDWLHAQLLPALDRIRWLVPTEALDEFVLLWSHETRRHVRAAGFVTNIAPPDPLDSAMLQRIVAAMPELYALDLDLWVRAQRRMEAYRRQVLLQGIDPRGPATEAFVRWTEAIWLTEGWLPPICYADGTMEWWAGPSRVSRLHLRRSTARILRVDISVVNGIRRDEIQCFTATDYRQLPSRLGGEDGTLLDIELDGVGSEAELLLVVPKVYSPIEVNLADTDTSLRSFAGRHWRLV